jgi:carboxyl-terminal processing protease
VLKLKSLNTTLENRKRGLALAGALVSVAFGALALETATSPATTNNVQFTSSSATVPAAHPLAPGPNDGRIAYVAARMLSENHYSHHPLDNEYSEKFFDRYLESLDPQHLHFTQADLAEFDHYRDQLDELTLGNRRTGDASPAFEIFSRFRQRLEQRGSYAAELLKAGRFAFDTDERMQTNRKDAPYPKDEAEARELWRQRLRFEYLQEKLAKHATKKTAETGWVTGTLTWTNAATGEPVSVAITNGTSGAPVAKESKPKKKPDAEEITETLTRRYARNLRFFKEWDNEDVMQVYLNALAHVYDPHSDYFNKVQADNFAIGMNNTLFGIGAVLTTDADGFCKIQELKPGPAMNSKQIKAGDRIVAVAQGEGPVVDAVEMALNKVVQMIRGPKGTEVRLTIQPANADSSDRHVISLIRDEIKLEDQAAKAKVIELPTGHAAPLRLGVIDLPSFYAPIDFGGGQPLLAAAQGRASGRYTSRDVAGLLKKFKEGDIAVAGVILDLRRNGGGSLEEAVKLTGLFIKQGPVVQVQAANGDRFVDEDDDPSVAYDGPLIVLTSRFSASASEIVAGALQDYGRALIVGDQSTHGKGTVQQVRGLRQWVTPATVTATNDPGQIKITMSKFYRANGASTQLRGVLPDIVLPSILSYSKDIGEAALENPLEWDEIPSAKFQKLDFVVPFLGELLNRSSARLATNQDYVYIREDIELFRKNQADKTILLNETQRLKEKEEAEARQKSRDKERLARQESNQKIYELTLKQLDLPGLPAPLQKTNPVVAQALNRPLSGAGLSTNSVASAGKVSEPANKLDDEDEEEKPPAVDAALEETERILMDYISMLSRQNLISAKQ